MTEIADDSVDRERPDAPVARPVRQASAETIARAAVRTNEHSSVTAARAMREG